MSGATMAEVVAAEEEAEEKAAAAAAEEEGEVISCVPPPAPLDVETAAAAVARAAVEACAQRTWADALAEPEVLPAEPSPEATCG